MQSKIMDTLLIPRPLKKGDSVALIAPSSPPAPGILRRADEMGVRFIATADAHFLDGGWGPFTHHDGAEAVIDRLGLHRARVSL